MPFSFKAIAIRFVKNGRTQSTSDIVHHHHDSNCSVPAGAADASTLPEPPPDPSLAQAVSTRRETGPQVSTPGAYDVAQLALSGVNGVVAPIPLVGGSLQAAINGLSTLLQTINRHTQNRAAIASLRRRLNRLSVHLCNAPIARDGLEQLRREDLISVLQETSDQLKKLDKRFLGYQSVPQTIAGCSSDLDQYLAEYAFSAQMQVQNYVVEMRETLVRQFGESAATDLPGTIKLGCLILADATGHEHNIPLEFCTSFQQLNKMLEVLFLRNSFEAHFQRKYMEQGQYDLCIDRGTQVIELTSEPDGWSRIEAGTKVVMRVIIEKQLQSKSVIKCDACGCSNFSVQSAGIQGRRTWTVCCRGCKRRYQVSVTPTPFKGTRVFGQPTDPAMMHLIRNMHVRETTFREEFFHVEELREHILRRRLTEFEFRERDFRFEAISLQAEHVPSSLWG